LPRADDIGGIVGWLKAFSEPSQRELFRLPAQALARQHDLSRNIKETLAVFERFGKKGTVAP
jgi:hypothetical protein